MAIQVSGTEVISNTRVLSNVTGLKTVNGNALLGSGNIVAGATTAAGTFYTPANGSASTNFGFIGRYIAVMQSGPGSVFAGTSSGTISFTGGATARMVGWLAIQT